MAARAGEAGPELVDHRGVGKVDKFSGKREDFEGWIFPFESYCALLGWSQWMETARDHLVEIGEGDPTL